MTMMAMALLLSANAAVASTEPPESDRNVARNVARDVVHGAETVLHDAFRVISSPARMDRKAGVWTGAVLAATGLIYAHDQDILDAELRNSDAFPLDRMNEVGDFLDPIGYGRANVFVVGGLVGSYAAGWQTGTDMCGQMITAGAVFAALRIPIHALVGRSRPYSGQGPRSFGNDDATSFPSGHTFSAFTVATITSHHIARPWYTVLAYGSACCVGVQRLNARAHWPSDVFLTAAYAVAVNRGIISLYEERGATVVPYVGPGGSGAAVSWRF